MDCKTEEFEEYLDKCYFHGSRDKCYQSEQIKNAARQAMKILWNKQSISAYGVTYSQDDIRKRLLNDMMPEILDRAIEVFLQAENVKCETAYLASCIFRTLINYDVYIERLFRQTYLKYGSAEGTTAPRRAQGRF